MFLCKLSIVEERAQFWLAFCVQRFDHTDVCVSELLILLPSILGNCSFVFIMDVFSLEEDDCSQLFITQSLPKSGENRGLISDILGNGSDFTSPCVSLVNRRSIHDPQYSNISDDDFVDIPSSQQQNNLVGSKSG